mmetsp:Transcript_35655/g.63034  ORF Transcript_35655/g.63034 Transcript_35655/m.63034 type:complete len:507 (+) Transcript_35655:91-1611(+)
MAVLAALALVCCLASGNRIQIQYFALQSGQAPDELSHYESPLSHDKTRISLQSETKYFYNRSMLGMEVAEEIEIEEESAASSAESVNPETSLRESGSEVESISVSSTAEKYFHGIDSQDDVKTLQNEVKPEDTATVMPLTGTTAEEDSDVANLQADLSLAEQEAIVAALTGNSAEQDVNLVGLQDDARETQTGALPKAAASGMQLPGTEAEVHTHGSLAELDASVVSPITNRATEDFYSVGETAEPGLGPQLEATVTLLAGTSDKDEKDKKGQENDTKSVAIVAMTTRNSSGTEQHSLQHQQHQTESLHSARWPGFGSSRSIPENFKSFLTTVNALSESSFGYVSRPFFNILALASLVAIISLLIRSYRFCLSRKLSCGLSNGEARHQCFHEGRLVYEWDQTLKDITVYLRPPQGQLAQDLDIKISSRHLRVGRRGRKCFLTEETYDVVNAEMSSWLLRRNGELQICIRKVRRSKWPTAFLHKGKLPDGHEVQSDASSSNLSRAMY